MGLMKKIGRNGCVAKKGSKKKASRPIKGRGYAGIQEFDYGKFQQMFDTWKTQCNVGGSKLGVTSETKLIDLIKNHGVVARPYTKNKVSRSEGAGSIVEMLEEWDNDAAILEEVDLEALDDVIKALDNMRDSDTDPRNIRFTVPIPSEVDEDTGDYDDDDVTIVYGHYRTPDYNKVREILSGVSGREKKETISPVNPSWYATGSDGKNTAKPPMWQALFANGDGDIVKYGLYYICQEAKKLTKKATITNLKLKVDDEGDGLLAADLIKIPSVKRWVESKVGTMTSPGPGINKKTLHWMDRPMYREAINEKFAVAGLNQSEFLKREGGLDEIAGTIKTFQLNISRRQVRKLATLTGKCKKYPGRDVVYHVSKDVKKKKEVKKSWEQIIGKTF